VFPGPFRRQHHAHPGVLELVARLVIGARRADGHDRRTRHGAREHGDEPVHRVEGGDGHAVSSWVDCEQRRRTALRSIAKLRPAELLGTVPGRPYYRRAVGGVAAQPDQCIDDRFVCQVETVGLVDVGEAEDASVDILPVVLTSCVERQRNPLTRSGVAAARGGRVLLGQPLLVAGEMSDVARHPDAGSGGEHALARDEYQFA